MKAWISGATAAVLVYFLFPKDPSIPDIWTKALQRHSTESADTSSSTPLDAKLLEAPTTLAADSLVVPRDPFGLPTESVAPRKGPRSASTDHVQPPPRPWKATGRVGERAAVLTATDGRILVVKGGTQVDSAIVVSIGNDGVVLEDRGGRFLLRIP